MSQEQESKQKEQKTEANCWQQFWCQTKEISKHYWQRIGNKPLNVFGLNVEFKNTNEPMWKI